MRIIERRYNMTLDKETLEFMRFSNHVRSLVIEYLEYHCPPPPPPHRGRQD
jgi:hypothetical protein